MELTFELAKIFHILVSPEVSMNDFHRSLDLKVIRLAVSLQEKIQSSIHHYWFGLNEYDNGTVSPAAAGQRDHVQAATKLLDELESGLVECEDMFRNRRRFDAAKHLHNFSNNKPNSSVNEVQQRLYPIGTMSPRLMMQQVGRGEIIKEPRVVRKQRTLIAWASPESRAAKFENNHKTLMNALYLVKPQRGEGGGFLRWA